jgi:hypothetical protein
MKTPDTIEGFLTEAIMHRITRKVGKMPTHNYNAIYSAVLEALKEYLPDIQRWEEQKNTHYEPKDHL